MTVILTTHDLAGVVVVQAVGAHQDADRRGPDDSGRARGRVEGDALDRLIGAKVDADLGKAKQVVEGLLAGDPIPTGEFSRLCKDGSIGYHTFSASPVFSDHEVIGLEGFLTDITENKKNLDALRTDLGRTVYGGGGITPDVEIKAPPLSSRLFYGIFDFVRQLTAGQMQGLRTYRIGECQYKTKVSPEDINRYPITDELVAAFRQYISNKPQFNVSEERINANLTYILALSPEQVALVEGALADARVDQSGAYAKLVLSQSKNPPVEPSTSINYRELAEKK